LKIIIDMQGLQSNSSSKRGVGRYINNIVRHLLVLGNRHEFYLALNGSLRESARAIREDFNKLIPNKNIVVWYNYFDCSGKTGSRELIFAGELLREMFLQSFMPDIIYCPNLQEGFDESLPTSVGHLNFPSIKISNLHDLIPYFYENQYLSDRIIKKWYVQKIQYAIRSDVIITGSQSSKNDILDKLPVEANKVVCIENGIDHIKFNPSELSEIEKNTILFKYSLPKEFILYIGGNDQHKNIPKLILGYSLLPKKLKSKFPLVLGGGSFLKDPLISTLVDNLRIKEFVYFPGYIDDIDLPSVLKLSHLFVFPSTHEGFGLPVLESMAVGVPVIGSGSSSIREIICNNDALFDSHDENSIAKKIHDVLTNPLIHESIKKNGLFLSQNYSWNSAARKLLTLFESFDVSDKRRFEFEDPAFYLAQLLNPLLRNQDAVVLNKVANSITDSFPIARSPRIFLDVSAVVVHDFKTGIQRVVRSISKELLEANLSGYDFFLINSSNEINEFLYANSYARRISGANVPQNDNLVNFISGDILIYLDLHPSLAISKKDFNLGLISRGVDVYYVVYDLLPISMPSLFWPELCQEFNCWLEAISEASGAMCISNDVANQLYSYISKHGLTNNFRIGAFPLGVDILSSNSSYGFSHDAKQIIDKLISNFTFLMVGTIEPRKAYPQVLSAFETIWENGGDHNLVIVGKLGWQMQEFYESLKQHPQLFNKLFFLEGISDEFLLEIYKTADCLVLASKGEGFGLPIIEAAQFGVPIIARDIPVFREVGGDGVFYFEDRDEPAVVTNAIDKWIFLHNADAIPVFNKLKLLTWLESSQALLQPILNCEWMYLVNGAGALPINTVQSIFSKRIRWIGFYEPEFDFRWTSSERSVIKFIWCDISEAILDFNFNTHNRQLIELFVNEVRVYSGYFSGDNLSIVCSTTSLTQGINYVTIHCPMICVPSFNDPRLLGIAIKSFSIRNNLLPITTVSPIRHNSLSLLFRGFSLTESDLRWTDGNNAYIFFSWSSECHGHSIVINFDTLDSQRIEVSLNDLCHLRGVYSGKSLKIHLPLENIKIGLNKIHLYLPNAKQPSEDDLRFLALAFKYIELF